MGYTKLFSELVASSVWDEDDKTRIVWITMLALKDRHHFVRGTVRYLALAARVELADCEKALEKLSGPDAHSRCQLQEGRRILAVDGGWQIISGEYYSKMLSQDERRAYNAEKQREYRKRRKSVIDAGGRNGAAMAINEGMRQAVRSEELGRDVSE